MDGYAGMLEPAVLGGGSLASKIRRPGAGATTVGWHPEVDGSRLESIVVDKDRQECLSYLERTRNAKRFTRNAE